MCRLNYLTIKWSECKRLDPNISTHILQALEMNANITHHDSTELCKRRKKAKVGN